MQQPPILVVIVNYRTPDLTIDALASLAAEVTARGDTHVVTVENGSGDDSATRIAACIAERGWSEWCTLLPSERNGGFAAGNNLALRWYAEQTGGRMPERVWLLNPDTRAHPGAIAALIDFLAAHPNAGIAGGRCLWEDSTVRHSAFRFHSPLIELTAAVDFGPFTRLLGGRQVALSLSDAPMRVDWVSGSSFMIRREVLERIGLMDEAYFLYFEESDYCARAADAGFEVWTVPDSVITHLGGKSTGVTGAGRSLNRRPRYWFASRARFFRQRYGKSGAHLANALWLVGYPVGRAIAGLRGKALNDPPRLWLDFLVNNYGPRGLMYAPKKERT